MMNRFQHNPWKTTALIIDLDQVATAQRLARTFCCEDWDYMFAFFSDHLIVPFVYSRLKAKNLDSYLPERIKDAMEIVTELNDIRNAYHETILYEASAILNSSGITPCILKGAICLIPEQYPHARNRFMSDIDLLVNPTDISRALKSLTNHGFYCSGSSRDELDDFMQNKIYPWSKRNAPPLWHPSGEGYIEIHFDLFHFGKINTTLGSEMLRNSRVENFKGVRVKIPSLPHRLIHNGIHHFLQDSAYWNDQRSLRQLIEFYELWKLMDDDDQEDFYVTISKIQSRLVRNALCLQLLSISNLFGSSSLRKGFKRIKTQHKNIESIEDRFWSRRTDKNFDLLLRCKYYIQHGINRRLEILLTWLRKLFVPRQSPIRIFKKSEKSLIQ